MRQLVYIENYLDSARHESFELPSSGMDAISGLDRGIVDGGTDQRDPGLEINLVNAGINLPVYARQDLPLDIGITASSLPFVVNPPPTKRAFEGYSLGNDLPPNTQIGFSEVTRQREISEKQKLSAVTGLYVCRTLPSLLRSKLQSEMIQCLDCSDQDEQQMKNMEGRNSSKNRKVPPSPRLRIPLSPPPK